MSTSDSRAASPRSAKRSANVVESIIQTELGEAPLVLHAVPDRVTATRD